MTKEVRRITHALTLRLATILVLLGMPLSVTAQDDAEEGGLTGTGIYGPIAESVAFTVNGQTVQTSGQMDITDAIGRTSEQDLNAGNIVAVQVDASGAELSAISIRRIFAMIGPVQAISEEGLTIMGTDIPTSDIRATSLQPGDWVAVSGFWRETDVAATRIDGLAPQEFAQMTSTYFPPDAGEIPSFGTSQLSGLQIDALSQGAVLSVVGHPSAEGIEVVQQFEGLFDENVRYVSTQGYLSTPKADGFYTVIGSGLIAFNEDLEMPVPAKPVLSCGIDGILIGPVTTGISDADRVSLLRMGC